MGIFKSKRNRMDNDGGNIGLPFTYLPLRDPRELPVTLEDLIPSMEFSISSADEFYAKYVALVLNRNFDESIFATWANTYNKDFDSYKLPNMSSSERNFANAATTGFLMAVSEEEVFKVFKKGMMPSYLPGAMLNYLHDRESNADTSLQIIVLTGLLSGYHKAHDLYSL